MDPRDRDTDNRLRRRSHQSLRVDLDRQMGAWSLGGTALASGYRYDDANNQNRLPGYVTFNLRAGWEFAPDWTARLTLQNVTDKEYATATRCDGSGYLAAGTAGFLSIRYAFR